MCAVRKYGKITGGFNMTLFKKISILLLSLVCAVACAFGVASCDLTGNSGNTGDKENSGNSGNSGNNGNNGNTENTGGENIFAEGWSGDEIYHWHAAEDGSDAVDGKALHDWAKDDAKCTPATCAAAGTNVFKCSVCEKQKEERIAQLSHSWSEVKTNEATCITAGLKYKECTNAGCGATSTVETIPALGHHAEVEATCTEAAYCTREGCNALVEPAKGHNYLLKHSVEATCIQAGHDEYECTGCGNYYEIITKLAVGHTVVWHDDERKNIGTQNACYAVLGECVACGTQVESDTPVADHVFTSSIVTEATCTTAGEKAFVCNCGYTYNESYTDADAHTWEEPVTNGNIATYTCSHNDAHTKKSVISTNTSADIAVSDLTNAGSVTLAGTSIALDEGVKNTISGKDTVKLSADKLSGSEIPDLSDPAFANETIYNLTLTAGGNNISDLGGTVTVSIPYTLEEGDDPDNIVIIYINGDTPEEVTGKYSKGYVIFQTTHFSYYTVTRMTAAERCAKFGHVEKTVTVQPTCLLAGYEITLCTRCGKNTKKVLPALGHDWEENKSAATCTQNGTAEYTCKTCNEHYNVLLLSMGHTWQMVSHKAATCEHSGHAEYECSVCKESYVKTEQQKNHAFKVTVIAPTCSKEGYTSNKCMTCGFESVTDHVDALGHTKSSKVVAPTCTLQGFILTYCTVCGEEISKTNVVEPVGHMTVNGVCIVCGDGCKHEYVAGETVAPTCTDGGYTLYTCSKCKNSYKGGLTEALGHDYVIEECSRCHAVNAEALDYYINLISAGLEGTVTIRLQGVEFTEYRDVIKVIGGNKTVEDSEKLGTFKQLESAEISLKLAADGTITGSGYAKVMEIVNDIEIIAGCKAVVKDEQVYLVFDSDSDYSYYEQSGYMVISLDWLFERMSDGYLNCEKFKEYLTWYNTEVLSIINKTVAGNSNLVAKAVKYVLDAAFEREVVEGGYSYTVDYGKIIKLNDFLYENTLATIADKVLGEGVLDSLPAVASTLLVLTPADAIAILEELGINKSQVCLAVDALYYIYTGEIISSEELLGELLKGDMKDLTVVDIIVGMIGDDITGAELILQIQEELPAMIEALKDVTVYDIIAKEAGMEAAELYEMVAGYIDQYLPLVEKGAKLGFTTDKKGNLTSAKIIVDVEDLPVGGDVEDRGYYKSYTKENGIEVVRYYLSDGDILFAVEYAGVISDINGKVYDSIDELLATLDLASYEHLYKIDVSGELEFLFGKDFDIDNSVVADVTAQVHKFEPNKIFTAYSYKNTEYHPDYPAVVTREKGSEMRIHTDSKGNIIKIVETTETRYRYIRQIKGVYFVCEEDYETSIYEYDLSSGIIMINKDYCKDTDEYNFGGKYSYSRTYKISNLIVHTDTGFVISDAVSWKNSEEYEGSSGSTSFYYNAVKNVFYGVDPHSGENLVLNEDKSKIECGGFYYYECPDCGYCIMNSISHLTHDFKEEYKLIGGEGSSCEQGVLVKEICPDCGEVYNKNTYYEHYTHYLRAINLKDYGSTCEHTLDVYGCVCGKREYTRCEHDYDYWEYELGDKWDSIEMERGRVYLIGQKFIPVTLFVCTVSDCNFKFAWYTENNVDNQCRVIEHEHWLFGVIEVSGYLSGGTEVVISDYNQYSYAHDNNYREETKVVDGITVNIGYYECRRCGLIDYRTESYDVIDGEGRTTKSVYVRAEYSNSADNFVTNARKEVNTFTYDSNGNTLTDVRVTTYYDGDYHIGDAEENISSIYKREYLYTYNSEGLCETYKNILTEYNAYGEINRVSRYEYLYVLGYEIRTLRLEEYYSEGTIKSYHKYEYIYEDGEYCSPTVIESTEYGESEPRPGEINHRTEGNYILQPTCTQCGILECIFCHEEVQGSRPHGHDYTYMDGKRVCRYCGLESMSYKDGGVIFEDFSYASDTDYVIGYHNDEGLFYNIYIALVFDTEDGEDERIIDIVYTDTKGYDYYGSGKIIFAVADIQTEARKLELDGYMIRVTFSPAEYGSELDYSITIDAHNWVQGTLTKFDRDSEEEVSVAVYYCAKCGLVKEYGYIMWETCEKVDGVYYYSGYSRNYYANYTLAASAPIIDYNIPAEDETLYTVTFDFNYAQAPGPMCVVVYENETVAAPEIPERANITVKGHQAQDFTFEGWYTDKECTAQYDFSAIVTEDLQLYAKWNGTYIFEAEHVSLTEDGTPEGKPLLGRGYSGEAYGADMVDPVPEGPESSNVSNGHYVDYLYKQGLGITFFIESDRDIEDATLIFRITGNNPIALDPAKNEGTAFETANGGTIPYSKYTVTVNGQAVNYDSILIKDATGFGAEMRPFSDYVLAVNLSLKKGTNTFTFLTDNSNDIGGTASGTAPVIDCIKIITSAYLSWKPVTENERGQ